MRINSVGVRMQPPTTLPGFGAALRRLHSTTRAGIVQRDLLFAAGDTVDTLRVGESLRRLRHRPYLADASVAGYHCSDTPGVDLVVTTRDRWSLQPTLAVQSNSSYGGIQEKNLFGSGREASILIASRNNTLGGAVGFSDPYFLHLPMSAKFRAARYSDGSEFRGRIQNQERSVFDPWREQFIFSRYTRDASRTATLDAARVLVEEAFYRETALVLFGHRINRGTDNVTSILFGADAERASLNAPDNALTVGPKLAARRYYGPNIGLARRAAGFDTLSWLAERQVLVDVPIGVEWDGLIGVGREDVARRPASRLSGWIGRMWIPARDRLFQVDAWGSGYRIAGQHNFEAASARMLASGYLHRDEVVWAAHVSAEKLVNPDPDVRVLAMVDPTIAVIPTAYRLSENAVAGSLDRAMHLLTVRRSVGLNGALFVAGSFRTASPLSQNDHFGVTVVGAGLRIVPMTPGSGVLRLDLMYPVLRSPLVRKRVVFAVSIAPWLESNRQREDSRLRQ